MPEKQTIQKARKAARRGKAPSSQAGEFVREEIHHVREGKHGARSAKQAIAIGLSKARKAGVRLPPPPAGSQAAKKSRARRTQNHPSARRSRAILKALRREPHAAASHHALATHAKKSAQKRGHKALHLAAVKAVHTKGKAELKRAAKKAAHTRHLHAA